MRVALVFIATLAIWPARVEAKYHPCTGSSVLVPSERVPRNAKLWWWEVNLGVRFRLRDHDRVPTEHAIRSSALAHFDPGVLEASSTYDIEVVIESSEGAAWKVGELRTGSSIDLEAPRRPSIDSLAITQLVEDGEPGTCCVVPASEIALELDVSTDTLALDISYDDSPVRQLIPAEDIAFLGRDRCGPQRTFNPGSRVCMTIRAIDMAGNTSEPATRCTIVAARIGDTTRIAHKHEFPRPQQAPERTRYGWLVGAGLLAAYVLWLAIRNAVRRAPHAP